MTRPTPRRPAAPHPKPAFALNGAAVCPPSEARAWTIAAWLVIGAFVAASLVVITGPHRVGDYFTESDFYGAYVQGARLIQHGHLVPSRYTVVGPGYEVALALVGVGVRNLFLAAQLLSIASASCIAWAWFALLRNRVDARLGAAMLLFLCTNDGFFRYASSATTDAFGIALQSVALLVLLVAPRIAASPGSGSAGAAGTVTGATTSPAHPERPRRFVIAGLLAAFAFLTRYNALVLLPAGLLAILLGGAGAARRGRAALLFTLGFLLPVVPWVAYSLAHGGTLATQLHHNIAYEVFARSRGIAWDDYQKKLQSQFPNLGAVIARDPGAVASRMLANVAEHLKNDAVNLLGWPVAIAALAGAAFSIRNRWIRRLWPVLATGAMLFLTLVPVFYSERYSLALLPVYATLAGAAFASPALALALGRGRRVWLKAAAAPAVIALALPAGVARQAHTFDQLPIEVLDAGRVLHAMRLPGDRVISRKAHIAYYGDCEPIGFPFADSLSDLARYARDAHARWLYMSWPEAETRPRFYFLLDTASVVPGLTVRYASPWRPAVLYEIGPGFGATPAWLPNDTLRGWHTLRGRARIDGTNPQLFTELGIFAYWAGRIPEARDALQQALALDPNRFEAASYLGRALVALGDYEGACGAYGRALELKRGDADSRVGYGLASFLAGRDREAAAAWRPVIALTIEPRILRAMAQLYDSLGDTGAAQAARAQLAQQARR
jgi:hypothetical protein